MCGKRFYPSAAIALYLFNYVRDDYVTWEEEQYMHMVINTNNPYDLAASSVYKLADIAMYTLNVLLSDGWTCCLNVEYQMYVYFAQWLCHVLMLLPFQGVITFRHVNPGCRFACPGLCAPLGFYWHHRLRLSNSSKLDCIRLARWFSPSLLNPKLQLFYTMA